MNVESWIGLATVAIVIGTAIVHLAMRIATLQANVTANCEDLDDEIKARQDGDKELAEQVKSERAERSKKDSDVLGEVKETRKRIERWERRQIEMGWQNPPESDSDEELET